MSSAPQETSGAVAIEVRDLHKRFGAQEVLKGVSLEVKPGEIFALMGPSGSGKSVLLKHIIGLEKADRGTVTIGGLDASDPATHRQIHTAMVFQAGALFNSMTVFDNLALYLREHRLANEKEIRRRVGEAMEALGIADAARKIPAELSGGMRKRVAVARSIVMEPQVILYDEPTSELDPVTAATVSELIAEMRHRVRATSFVVTHDRELALGIADTTALLMAGELVFRGSPRELAESDDEKVAHFMHPRIRRRDDQPVSPHTS
jgi:phospholipid/cholesterol/gamma-HCH transport system ATP-binding protein